MNCRPAPPSAITRFARRGFTLLEVLLSLILLSLILGAIATAIDVHLRVLDVGRTDVEQAQLARAVLQMIAKDLRNVVVRNTAGESTSGGQSSSGSAPTDGGSETSYVTESYTLTEESSIDDFAFGRSTAGLYGTADWIQIDVSRLPRLDQFQGILASDDYMELVDYLGDVRSVLYFIELDYASTSAEDPQTETGLFRCEMDRAVGNRAYEQAALAPEAVPLAPEVVALQFLYYDGATAYSYWDSEEQGKLPSAVEVIVGLLPDDVDDEEATWYGGATLEDVMAAEDLLVYRLLVALPVTEPISNQKLGGFGGEAASEANEGAANQPSAGQR